MGLNGWRGGVGVRPVLWFRSSVLAFPLSRFYFLSGLVPLVSLLFWATDGDCRCFEPHRDDRRLASSTSKLNLIP